MAGGKLTARQKMINLMYLVFIAMMALNMSREALTAFAMMDAKFVESNKDAQAQNKFLLEHLDQKAGDEPVRYGEPYEKAKQISALSNEFYNYLGELRQSVIEPFEKNKDENGNLPYEQMDKAEVIDYGWFVKDKYSEKGEEIVAKINGFRDSFNEILGIDATFDFLKRKLDDRFNTDNVIDADGNDRQYLDYHYKGLPSVSAMAKLSAMQNDIRQVEQEAYNLFLGNSLKEAASFRNYKAMVFTDKSVYFEGEPITGSVALARFDDRTVPTKVVVNGQEIDLKNANSFKDGQVQINTRAGRIGEHKFVGQFTFLEDGEVIPVNIESSNYVVVPRPNSATIAADRMNVVYMGLDNPISASFAGVPSDKVTVTTSSGSLRKTGDGKYILTPSATREVVITAKATLPDGTSTSDQQTFRVKPVPRPFGTIRGTEAAQGPINNLKISTIGAKFDDFEFDVSLQVTEYTIIFPRGLGSEVVKGSTGLSESAKRKADQLKSGDIVRITGIKTRISGVDMRTKDAADATYTIQ